MRIDLAELAARVRSEVASYEPPSPHPQTVGSPLPRAWFDSALAEMTSLLVEPYLAELDVFDFATFVTAVRQVAVVADDGDGYLLVFDPGPDGDFALAFRQNGRLNDIHVRGDAVGCFLAR